MANSTGNIYKELFENTSSLCWVWVRDQFPECPRNVTTSRQSLQSMRFHVSRHHKKGTMRTELEPNNNNMMIVFMPAVLITMRAP